MTEECEYVKKKGNECIHFIAALCNRKSPRPWGDTRSSGGTHVVRQQAVEEQDFPKSSASPGSPWTPVVYGDNDNIANKSVCGRDAPCVDCLGFPPGFLVSLTLNVLMWNTGDTITSGRSVTGVWGGSRLYSVRSCRDLVISFHKNSRMDEIHQMIAFIRNKFNDYFKIISRTDPGFNLGDLFCLC